MRLFSPNRVIHPRRVARLRSPALGFASRGEGAVLIEAAIVIPILVMLLVGMVEFSQAFTARRRAGTVAITTADLVAQASSVTTSDLNDIVSVANNLMAPYPVAPLSVTVSSVGYNSNNTIVTLWSCAWTSISAAPSCTATGAAATLPSGLVLSGEAQSIILVQTSYVFKPAVGEFLLGGVTFSQTAYFTPRLSAYVQKL
jgi:Flp pilus assembly protein TadG